MADELDEDVQALKNWLRDAWRLLASNLSLTRFDRRELRNSMKQEDATLRGAISQLAAKETVRRQALPPSDRALLPDFRVLANPIAKDAQDVAAQNTAGGASVPALLEFGKDWFRRWVAFLCVGNIEEPGRQPIDRRVRKALHVAVGFSPIAVRLVVLP
jgi:hypothetical protein